MKIRHEKLIQDFKLQELEISSLKSSLLKKDKQIAQKEKQIDASKNEIFTYREQFLAKKIENGSLLKKLQESEAMVEVYKGDKTSLLSELENVGGRKSEKYIV